MRLPYLFLKRWYPNKGTHINSELITIAPIAPGAVAFQIHQMVPPLNTSIARKAYSQKLFLTGSLSATTNNGIQAKKIKNVSGDIGHAQTNNKPDSILKVTL